MTLQKPESILVISAYPPRGRTYGHLYTGAASYTKNTLMAIKKHLPNASFTVLAEKEGRQEHYIEDGIAVKRVWQLNSIFLYWTLLRSAFQERNSKKIFIEFEWTIFGTSYFLIILFPIFLLMLRLLGKKIYLVSHAVLLDASSVAGQIGSSQKSLKIRLLNICLKLLYFFITLLSNYIVVFEEGLKEELSTISWRKRNIIVIPHGVDTNINTFSKKEARKKLGIPEEKFIVMCFGFLIWYKGSDWIVDIFKKYKKKHPKTKISLWMVGGPNKRNFKNTAYKAYIDDIMEKVKDAKDIHITGYIDEKEIPLYYSASDVQVLPYRLFVSSSGPLSFAFTFKKPVILSSKLHKYLETQDITKALQESGLTSKDILFSLDQDALGEKLEMLIKSPKLINQLSVFSELVTKERNWNKIGEKYARLLEK